MRLLVTAGPTREHLDPVRFLTNASSGRLGTALAAEASRRGHRVALVLGPCPALPPEVDELIRVTSTAEMLEAVDARFDACDALIAAAAPCDYRPARRAEHKIRKGDAKLVLELERTPDILATMAERRTVQVLVGFCLETQDLEARARAKLRAKGLDLVVGNTTAAVGAARQDAILIGREGEAEHLAGLTKEALASRLIDALEALAG
jgi:phosphopantothenoylcysteine decarboxylase/phosphopantothenate--cysteine ligase